MSETAFWKIGTDGRIVPDEAGIQLEVPDRSSQFPYVLVTGQENLELVFNEDLQSKGHRVDRPFELLGYQYDGYANTPWPLTASVKNYVSGATEIWRTNYILGCDGFVSTVQQGPKITIEPQALKETWLIADVDVVTDFPHYRRQCTFYSDYGVCLFIPRCRNAIRIVLQLPHRDIQYLDTKRGEAGHAHFMVQFLQRKVAEIISPYRLTVSSSSWVSRYSVTPSVANHFTDPHYRVFLLGDASHTHTPRASQGMNLAICDAHNLTWKLALVLKGLAKSGILQTYELERKEVAEKAIRFDAKSVVSLSQQTMIYDNPLHDEWLRKKGYTNGLGFYYPESILTNLEVRTMVAQKEFTPLAPGKRLPPIPLIRNIDGTKVHLADDMPCTARFHLIVFATKCLELAVFKELSLFLASPFSPLTAFSSAPHTLSSESFLPESVHQFNSGNDHRYLDMFLIHSTPHLQVSLPDLPAPWPQWSHRVYEDKDGEGVGSLGIMKSGGALVLVRPDGIVSMVTNLDDGRGILERMKIFMVQRN